MKSKLYFKTNKKRKQLLKWVMLNLVFGVHFFLVNKLWRVIMNYQAKSGASSLKIGWVMINLYFDGHFVFLEKKNCGWSLWTTMQNLELLAWQLTEFCSIYFLAAILFFGIIFQNLFLEFLLKILFCSI